MHIGIFQSPYIFTGGVTISDTTKQETYVGSTENQFKTRYRSHLSSFKNSKYRNSTELSKYIWTLKDTNVQYSIKWKVIKRCRPYSNISKRCYLCLHENFVVMYHPELCSLTYFNKFLTSDNVWYKHFNCYWQAWSTNAPHSYSIVISVLLSIRFNTQRSH